MNEVEIAIKFADPGPRTLELQLVRLSGTVLIAFTVVAGTFVTWEPQPGFDILGPCAARGRVLPDGEWFVHAFFPHGYPGPTGPFPGMEKELE